VAAAFVIWVSGGAEEGGEDNAGSPFEGKICVMPIGDVPEDDVTFACDVLAADLGREVVVTEPLPLQDSYYYAARDQYSAAGFLAYVEANAPDGAFRAVGLTAQDITIPQLNFLFGMGRCPGKAAVMSTYRLDFYCESSVQRRARFAKLLVHELGHTFGLLHCRQPLCGMDFAEGYASLDYSRIAFCERCEANLCELADLDAEERRKDLEEVVKKYGLWTELGGQVGMTPPPEPADLSPDTTGDFR